MKRLGIVWLLALAGCLSPEAAVNRSIVNMPPLENPTCAPGPSRLRLSENPNEKKSDGLNQSGLTHSEIHTVVRANIKEIQDCYNANALGLSGYLKTRLHISPSGCVYESSIAESTIPSSELASCVKKRVLSWKFPKPKGDRQVEIEYPLSFKGNGENTIELPSDPAER